MRQFRCPTMRQRGQWLILSAITLLVALISPGPAATLVRALNTQFVATTADNTVASTATDCTAIASNCTLRDALHAAANGDTIQFAATVTGTILLNATLGTLPVTHSVMIEGPGAGTLAVDGGYNPGHGTTGVPVFTIGNILSVTISGLTIQNGENTDTNSGGGGISVDSNDTSLTVLNCILSGNDAFGNGGGIYFSANGSTFAYTLNVANSILTGNVANGTGGDIAVLRAAIVNVTNSTLSGNIAGAGGGGIANGTPQQSGGRLTIVASTLNDNHAAFGNGGGLLDAVMITSSALVNTTLSGNHAQNGSGGGLFALYGGGAPSMTMVGDTVSGNEASGIGQMGGGAVTTPFLPFTITGTIIAGNLATNAATDPDLMGTFTSAGNALIGDSTGSSGFTNGVNGDHVGTAAQPMVPKLAPLGPNGGPTATQALLPTSPAIDAANPCPTYPTTSQPLATDQRGVMRPQGAACDIGAFEYQPVTPTLQPASAGTAGQRVTFAGSGFQTGTTVTLDGAPLAITVADDGNSFTAIVPGHAAGAAPIVVTNPGAGHTATSSLMYIAPNRLPPPQPTVSVIANPTPLPPTRPPGPPTNGQPTPNPLPPPR